MTPFSWEKFNTLPVVGILRNFPAAQTDALATHYADAGLTCLEVTMNTEGAADTIARLSDTFAGRLNIGAGTVCTRQDLDKALGAGAAFIVTPILAGAVIKTCVRKGIPVFPGAYTPTEIYQAWAMGADMVKVFPASGLGPAFIKEVLAPLDKLKLLPTGGVGLENMEEYLRAGAAGLGIGSGLFPKDLVNAGRWDELSALFNRFVNAYKNTQL
jgi:2-dehydro-3-deoxyphosphogluconate aldolase/(4S)-4-hydroxy-2-oxoglutarate aldolase